MTARSTTATPRSAAEGVTPSWARRRALPVSDLGAVSAKRIAEDSTIPPELLAKILQRLAKRKLIASVNGPKGGYVLARAPGQIRVSEVLRAIERRGADECGADLHRSFRRQVVHHPAG